MNKVPGARKLVIYPHTPPHASSRSIGILWLVPALLGLLLVALTGRPGISPVSAATSDLFFSEYVEGGSYNKALEIYNGTGNVVDLAAENYVIEIYFNGATSPGFSIPLNGMLTDGDVFVLAHSAASTTITNVADQINSQPWYNGNDAVVLRKGSIGTVIDVIGQVGFDPNSEWGSGLTSTQDHTLRRKVDVCAGDINPNDAFDPSVEWDGFATDTFDGLGSHTVSCAGGNVPPTVAMGGPYTVSEGGTVALDGSASSDSDGSITTYEWNLDGDGTYGETGIDAGRGDETGQTATFDAAGLDGPGSFAIALRVTDDDGATSTYITGIIIANVAPTADAGGPYTVLEGGTVTLAGSGSDPVDGLTYTWDLDGDGTFGEMGTAAAQGDETSATPIFNAGTLNAADTVSVTLRVDDGTTTTDATTTVTVTDNDIDHSISAVTADIIEGDSNSSSVAVFMIERTGRTDQPSRVDLSVTGGTAVEGSDYTNIVISGSGISRKGDSITFAAAATQATISIDIIGDTQDEGASEDIVMTISNPVTWIPGYQAAISTATATKAITDDDVPPEVLSIMCANADADPTSADSVTFTVTFAKNVTGVDAADFTLTSDGTLAGVSVETVTGSDTTWTVTVNTGRGSGTLRLDVLDDDTILDAVGNPLGDVGTGNGDFTSGEAYTLDRTAPTAALTATDVTPAAGSSYTFTVTYSDNLALQVSQLDDNDIRVTGPNGFDQPATFVSVDTTDNGTPRTATYRISAPGGTWDAADNGDYTVAIVADQVADTVGNSMAAGTLGSFRVAITAPGTTLYLPLIVSTPVVEPAEPDLVVTSVRLDPDKTSFTTGEPVTVVAVIENRGTADAGSFWVDLSLNPDTPPVDATHIWNRHCALSPCYGVAWYVDAGLAAGEQITLTATEDSFAPVYTRRPGYFAPGITDLYVYVDSRHPDNQAGAVLERDETNNRAELHGLSVTGDLPPEAAQQAPELPQRPAQP